VAREEAGPAGLERELLAATSFQDLDLVVTDDPVADDLVPVRAVRDLERDLVPRAEVVDIGERGAVGRAMPRDVGQEVLARKTRLRMEARAFLERLRIRSEGDHDPQVQAGHRQASDRLTGFGSLPVGGRELELGRSLLLQRPRTRQGLLALDPCRVCARELGLSSFVQDERYRVLPLPDRECPEQDE